MPFASFVCFCGIRDLFLRAYTTNFFQCFDIDLTNGNNTITLRATDWAGNVTVANVTYTLISDTNPPVITLVWPQDGMTVCGDSFTMSGSLDDPTATVAVSLVDAAGVTNLLSGLVERHGPFWVEDLPLSDGTNRLSILAVDAWGNSSTTNIVVIKSPFSLSFSPLDPSQLQQLTTTLYGTMADTTYTLRVNGILAAVYPGGAWQAERVPVGPGSTACFTAVAYPPGEDLRPDHAVSANSSPVKGDMLKYVSQDTQAATKTEHRHTDIYSSEDLLTKIEWSEIDSSLDRGHEWKYNVPSKGRWGLTESGHGSVSGDFANNCRATVEWPPAATPETSVGAWSVNPDCGGFRADDNPPIVGNEYCKVTAVTDLNSGPAQIRDPSNPNCGYYQKTSGQRNYTRTAQTTLKLFTGGKAIAHRKNLFSISATVNRVLDKFAWPPLAGARQEGISPSQTEITVGDFGKLGSDGWAYKVLEDSVTVDITPYVPGCDFYTFNAEPQKHRLLIAANGTTINPDSVAADAHFCVGQKLTFTASWDEPPPKVKSNVYDWVLSSKYVNEAWQAQRWVAADPPFSGYWEPCGSVNYRLNPGLLTAAAPFAWWISGGDKDKNARLDLTVYFDNGQSAKLPTQGKFTMFRPTASLRAPDSGHLDPYYKIVWQYLDTCKLKLGENDQSGDGTMNFNVNISSTFAGYGGMTQLITADYSNPVYSFSDERCDGTELYSTPSGISARPLGQLSGIVPLDDGPSDIWRTPNIVSLSCRDFVRFKPGENPNDPNNIWVTLGVVTWETVGTAEQDFWGNWAKTADATSGPSEPDGADTFPMWLINQGGMR